MQAQFTSRNFVAPQDLRMYASEKLSGLKKYYDGILDARIVLEHVRFTSNNSAEISLHVHRQIIKASSTADRHTDAIDLCIEQLRKQLIRHKEKNLYKYKRREKWNEDWVINDTSAYDDDF